VVRHSFQKLTSGSAATIAPYKRAPRGFLEKNGWSRCNRASLKSVITVTLPMPETWGTKSDGRYGDVGLL